MDGTIAPISVFCDLAAKYNALTFIDEVHAVGLYGNRGAGVAEEINEMSRYAIIVTFLIKAFQLNIKQVRHYFRNLRKGVWSIWRLHCIQKLHC